MTEATARNLENVEFDAEAVEGDATITLEPRTESVSVPPDRPFFRVPFFMPRAQVYYWSSSWQEAERESLWELGRGEARTFENPEDALRWLDEPEGE